MAQNRQTELTDPLEPGAAVLPRPQELAPPEITQEMIDHYVRVGNRMRSDMIIGAFAGIGRLIAAPFRDPVPGSEALAERIATSLTAIRCSAELLRDAPELPEQDRSRHARIVLAEEARLEKLVDELRSIGAPRMA